MDYIKRLEQQNELLREKVKELSFKEDRFNFFYSELLKRRNLTINRRAECVNNKDPGLEKTATMLAKVYENETDFINGLIME